MVKTARILVMEVTTYHEPGDGGDYNQEPGDGGDYTSRSLVLSRVNSNRSLVMEVTYNFSSLVMEVTTTRSLPTQVSTINCKKNPGLEMEVTITRNMVI